MAGLHAALALHRLEQDGGHRRVDGRLQGVEVVPGHVAEALGQRLERLVLGRLAGGVQRGQGAAVERAVGADHDVAAVAAPLAGQLDGALVGLGARVGEEHLAAAAEQAVEGRGHLAARARCRTGWRRAAACGPASAMASATAGWAWPSDGHGQAGQEVEVAPALRRPTARLPSPRTKVTGGGG